jgi:hypothetical protein
MECIAFILSRPFRINAVPSCRTSGAIHTMKQLHIPEEMNLQLRCSENFKACRFKLYPLLCFACICGTKCNVYCRYSDVGNALTLLDCVVAMTTSFSEWAVSMYPIIIYLTETPSEDDSVQSSEPCPMA